MADEKTITTPNVRFGGTFIDRKYKNYAWNGEAVIDKITGEILFKRKEDGKLVSFVQNDKYIHDIMVELRILMKNHVAYVYPSGQSAFFISTDYDVEDIGGLKVDVIAGKDATFSNTSLVADRRFEFNLSKNTNGFFIRPMVRDTDKNVIEYLCNEYDNLYRGYNGDNEEYQAEAVKFDDEEYAGSTASVDYTVDVTGTPTTGGADTTTSISGAKYIRVGEETFIQLPSNISDIYTSITTTKVSINSISFDKIHTMIARAKVDEDLNAIKDYLIAPDNSIYLRQVNIMGYIDSASDIIQNKNSVITCLMQASEASEYLGYVDKLAGSSGFIPLESRPTAAVWTNNNAWAEIIRTVNGSGLTTETKHETDVKDLEKFIYNTAGLTTNFTFDKMSLNDIFIESKPVV